MRKQIEGIWYDPAKAKRLLCRENGAAGDYWEAETLYRTEDGRYFIHGQGGGHSSYGRYAVMTPEYEAYTDGADIIVISEQEAREWAFDKATMKEYRDIFGDFTPPAGRG